jgi:hypothetical protein
LPIKGLENNRNLEFLFGTESSCFDVVFLCKNGWNSLVLVLAWFAAIYYGILKRYFVPKNRQVSNAKAAYALKQAEIFIHACQFFRDYV